MKFEWTYSYSILAGLLCLAFTSMAQVEERFPYPSYLNELYIPQNGLPVSNVNQVYQSSDGFIWMASYNGLVRFDGLRYKTYTVADYPELCSNRMITIQPGQKGGFWLTTENSHLINYTHGTFKHYGPFPDAEHQRILLDGDSLTWILASNWLVLNRGDKWIEINPDGLKHGASIQSFLRLASGDILLGASDGNIYRSRFPYTQMVHFHKLPPQVNTRILWSDDEGNIWHFNNSIGRVNLGEYEEPSGMNKVKQGWSELLPLYLGVQKMKDRRILLRAETGIFTLSGMEVQTVQKETNHDLPNEAERLGNGLCTCNNGDVWTYVDDKIFMNGTFQFTSKEPPTSIFCDGENNVWLTLHRKGVQRFRKSSIQSHVSEGDHNNFYGVYKDAYNRIWMGEWLRNLNYKEHGKLQSVKGTSRESSTAAFLETFDGRFYVGNLYLEDIRSKNESLDFSAFNQLKSVESEVFSIIQSKDSTVWFGTKTNLYTLKAGHVDSIDFPDQYYPVRFMIEDKAGSIWMATNGGGIYCLEQNRKTWRHYNKSNGLSSNNTRALLIDKSDYIWIATEDAGLDRLNMANEETQNVSINHGLYQNGIHSLQLDQFGKMWMSSNQGVFYVDRNDLEACMNGENPHIVSTIFTERDGMLNREANGGFQNSSFQDQQGILWYPTQEGAISIDPSISIYPQTPFQVLIDVVKSGDYTASNLSEEFAIPSGNSNIHISYTAPNFTSPERINYRYKLEGFDDEWQEVGSRNEAVFTNIPGGNYVFVVQAFTNQSLEALSESRLKISKPNSPTETHWFKILIGLMVIGAFFGIYQFRVQRFKMRQLELKMEIMALTQELNAEKANNKEHQG